MKPKPVPFGTGGILTIPDSAKEVYLKSEMTENGEACGPIFIDDKKLLGRWFTETEAKSIAKGLGAIYCGEPSSVIQIPPMPGES